MCGTIKGFFQRCASAINDAPPENETAPQGLLWYANMTVSSTASLDLIGSEQRLIMRSCFMKCVMRETKETLMWWVRLDIWRSNPRQDKRSVQHRFSIKF